MKRFRALLTALCMALVSVLTLGLVTAVGVTEVGAEEVTYDEVKVYDYCDLTGEESYTVSGEATARQLGTVTEKNNYAVKMKVSGWTEVPTHAILHIGGSDGWGNGGYIFHSEADYKIYKDRGNTLLAGTSGLAAQNDFAGMSEAVVEFGVRKAYEGGAYVGNYVYCNVNGAEKISVLDREGPEELAGNGVYIPESTFGINLQHMLGKTLSTTRIYDEAKVYDYYDLTGGKFCTVSGSDTAKLLGTVTEKNNYAVKMKVSGWTGVPTHIILHIGGSDGWGNGGYIFHSEADYKIYKDRGNILLAGTSGLVAQNDFAGMSEAIVEFGVKKAYEGGTYVGNYVYCKINDVVKISVLDREGPEELAGNGVYIPESTFGINLQHMLGKTLSTCYSGPSVVYKNGETVIAEKLFTGSAMTAPEMPAVADGKVFAGWETDGKLYPDGYVLNAVTEDMVFSAVYIGFGMKDGASIRIDEPTGIRFSAELVQSDYERLIGLVGEENVQLGMRVVRGETAYLDIAAQNRTTGTVNGVECIVFNGVIINILPENYKTIYCGTGYAELTYADGSRARIYAIPGDNSRTVAEVAKAAYDADNSLTQLKKYFEEGEE